MLGFLMLVGPREADMAIDSLSHALRLYPGSYACVRDDATSDGTYDALQDFARANAPRVCLSRNETAQGYFGLSNSMFSLYQHLWQAHPNLEIVIKLDTDACILRPGLDTFARDKFAAFGPGMLGSYRISPAGAIRGHFVHTKTILKDLLLVGRDFQTGRVRFDVPFYLPFLFRALLHGYIPGHAVLGGMYILHADTIAAAGRIGFWSSIPNKGSCHVKSEDALVSMGTKAVGHALIDINDPASGDVRTWLQYAPPIPWSAQEIVEKNYLAIHPVKNSPEGRKLRTELRGLLANELPSHPPALIDS